MPATPFPIDADHPIASLLDARPALSDRAAARLLDVSHTRVQAMREAGPGIEVRTLARVVAGLFPGMRLVMSVEEVGK